MKKIIFLTLLCSLVLPVVAAAGTDDDVAAKPNVIYVESATVAPGSNAMITVRLKSSNVYVTAFQFDLCLPAGVTIDGDVSGAIRKSELETSNHQLYAAWMKSGACRVICYSSGNDKLKSRDGEAAVIDINVDASVKPGTYPIILRNVEIARVDGKASSKLSKVQTTLTVQTADIPTDIQTAGTGERTDDATYNVLGQKVKKLRRGQIGIRRGKKTIEE